MIFSKVLMSDRNFPQFLEISMTKKTIDCALVQPKTVTLFIATVLVAVKMEIQIVIFIFTDESSNCSK